jgi:hypothetical protein
VDAGVSMGLVCMLVWMWVRAWAWVCVWTLVWVWAWVWAQRWVWVRAQAWCRFGHGRGCPGDPAAGAASTAAAGGAQRGCQRSGRAVASPAAGTLGRQPAGAAAEAVPGAAAAAGAAATAAPAGAAVAAAAQGHPLHAHPSHAVADGTEEATGGEPSVAAAIAEEPDPAAAVERPQGPSLLASAVAAVAEEPDPDATVGRPQGPSLLASLAVRAADRSAQPRTGAEAGSSGVGSVDGGPPVPTRLPPCSPECRPPSLRSLADREAVAGPSSSPSSLWRLRLPKLATSTTPAPGRAVAGCAPSRP